MKQVKKNVGPNCVQCGDPLTEQEVIAGDSCYMCAMEAFEEMGIILKKKQKIPPPEDYGRTEEEVKNYKQSRRKFGRTGYKSVTIDEIEWKPEERKYMMRTFGYDPAKKVITKIVARTDIDTRLIFEIPEIVEEGYKKLVQDVLDRTLDGILRLLTYGPHNNDIEGLLKINDSKPPG